MKIFKSIIFLFFISPFVAFAETETNEFTKYDLCEIEGYFIGFDNSFMAGLASYPIRFQSDISDFFTDSQCQGLRKFGIDTANKLKTGRGNLTPNEYTVLKKAGKFESAIEKSIIKLSNISVVKK